MRNALSLEVVEKKTVSLYEFREQILDSFAKILSATVSNDEFIEEMRPKILDLIGNQIKFLTEREAINKNSREEIDQKYLKLEKQVSLIEKFQMLEKGEPQIKANTEQEEIDKLKKDLVLNLKELNIRQEEDAHKKLLQFTSDYEKVEKNNIHLLSHLPSLIRNFQDIATPDNEKKIEKSVKYLEALGEVMIVEEIAKFYIDYEKGKENYPYLIYKLPKVIKSFDIIRKSDNKDKVNELTKFLQDLNKKMKDELRKIRQPKNTSREWGDIEPASLSPINEELEEEKQPQKSETDKEPEVESPLRTKDKGHREKHEELKRKNEPENQVSLTDNTLSFFAEHFNLDPPPKDISPNKVNTTSILEKVDCKSH